MSVRKPETKAKPVEAEGTLDIAARLFANLDLGDESTGVPNAKGLKPDGDDNPLYKPKYDFKPPRVDPNKKYRGEVIYLDYEDAPLLPGADPAKRVDPNNRGKFLPAPGQARVEEGEEEEDDYEPLYIPDLPDDRAFGPSMSPRRDDR